MGNSIPIGGSCLWQPALGVDHDSLKLLPGLAQGTGEGLLPEGYAWIGELLGMEVLQMLPMPLRELSERFCDLKNSFFLG